MVETGDTAEKPQNESGNSDSQRDKRQQEKKNKAKGFMAMLNPSDFWTAFFTGVLAFSSVCTLGAILYQGLVAKSQWNEMKKSSQYAQIAAYAARDSVVQAERNSRLDQRPWVMQSDMLAEIPEVNKPLLVKIPFKNTGKTLARNLSISVMIRKEPRGGQPPRFEDKSWSDGGKDVFNILLPPSGTYVFNIEGKSITPAEAGLINTGHTSLYVFGHLTYEDIFGEKHWTKYCFCYDVFGWRYFELYNDAGDGEFPTEK